MNEMILLLVLFGATATGTVAAWSGHDTRLAAEFGAVTAVLWTAAMIAAWKALTI